MLIITPISGTPLLSMHMQYGFSFYRSTLNGSTDEKLISHCIQITIGSFLIGFLKKVCFIFLTLEKGFCQSTPLLTGAKWASKQTSIFQIQSLIFFLVRLAKIFEKLSKKNGQNFLDGQSLQFESTRLPADY